MQKLFIDSLIPPEQLEDHLLEAHINRLFIKLESISKEWQYAWNKPDKEQVSRELRTQFSITSVELECSIGEYNHRMITMR